MVIDDDPTGCQTIHGVDVLLTWEEETIRDAVATGDHFFILTNSRSMAPEQARRVNEGVADILKRSGSQVRVISRSDSTLRGHFRAEIEGITAAFGIFDGIIVAPVFFEGARITRGATHYIQQRDTWIPVNETEFANDPDFAYKSAYLPEWIEEKTKGAVKSKDVLSVSPIDVVYTHGRAELPALASASTGTYVVLNAENYRELETLITAISALEASGKQYLYRSAASLVKTRLDIENRPLYTPAHTDDNGLVVVGSYVRKTTEQLNYLLANAPHLTTIEISIDALMTRPDYRSEISQSLNTALKKGSGSVVVYTERDHWNIIDNESNVDVHARVARFLSDIVSDIEVAPGFIIAKGGITSHDVAAQGLGVTRARVLGQLLAGVPVWQLYDGAFPAIDYVVFPGNVGGETALFDAYQKLSGYDKN